jgi:hypothetical protein
MPAKATTTRVSASRTSSEPTSKAKATPDARAIGDVMDLLKPMSEKMDYLNTTVNRIIEEMAPRNIVTKWRQTLDNGKWTGWATNAILLGAAIGGNWLLVDKIIATATNVD